ncbi:MAG: hypothetical protein K8S15_08730 [Candidatus Aegiribacteria sp.]|nr:hypothetical protein [Candidatus Aegiribacteria sp.]
MIRDDGKNFVIDWTKVSVSDFRFDLSLTMLLMSAYMEMKWRDPVLNEYSEHSGSPVDSICSSADIVIQPYTLYKLKSYGVMQF